MKLVFVTALAVLGVVKCQLLPVVDTVAIDQFTDEELADVNLVIKRMVEATNKVIIKPFNNYVADRFSFSLKTFYEVSAKFQKIDSKYDEGLASDARQLLELYAANEVVLSALTDLTTSLSNNIHSTGRTVTKELYAFGNETASFGMYLFNDMEQGYSIVKANLNFKQGTCLSDFEQNYWDMVILSNGCPRKILVTIESVVADWAFFLVDMRKSFTEWLYIDYLKTLSNEEVIKHLELFLSTVKGHITEFETETLDKIKIVQTEAHECLAKAFILNRSKTSFIRNRLECRRV